MAPSNSYAAQDVRTRSRWFGPYLVSLVRPYLTFNIGYFQSPAHFDSVSTVLLEQLGYAGRLPVLAELIPAIAELAVATESAAHYKKMNMKILKYLRSHNPEVRLAALQCEIALTRKLGEEWLALLPEMLPFISESREDDDEKVEKATQSWVNCIEEIMGESLNPMLQ